MVNLYSEAFQKIVAEKNAEKAENAEKHEQGRGEEDVLDVTCISSSQMQSIFDIQIRLGTALVSDLIPGCGSSQQLPFFVLHKVAQIHPERPFHLDIDLPSIVCPRTELDDALLPVIGEPGEVQFAGGCQDVRGDPCDKARAL